MIVCKVGGADGVDLDALADDMAALVKEGVELVLVHGGSAETNRVAEALGHPPRFVTSPSGFESRHTDRRTLEIFEMVYCGSVNKGIVERLQARGVDAVGLSGIDGGLWRGKRKGAVRVVEDGKIRVLRDNYTGKVEHVDSEFLRALLAMGKLPVLTPPAISVDGEAINVDGDRAAAATAAALDAEALLLLSNIPGLLSAFPDESSLVPELDFDELDSAREMAQGRMKMKLLGAEEALAGGVGRVIIGDARPAGCVRAAIGGAGTIVRRSSAEARS
jgi:acetylglutamate/LysW-gamma-L-alpha-aminoadipate kinase